MPAHLLLFYSWLGCYTSCLMKYTTYVNEAGMASIIHTLSELYL